ncbi:MAG: hypothetical protein F9B45_14845 [Phycisphaera sp. RhM]|nr:hypothetical protein [Phycisphaera sp. RhM]
MGKLTDIVREQGRLGDINSAWNTQIAPEDDVLPKGEYIADIVKGEPYESSSGHPAYKLTFEVSDGDFKGRRFWHDCYFSAKAEGRALRDLAKLGVPVTGTKAETFAALDQPLPAVFRCKVKLAIRRDDDGNEGNRVRRFDVLEVVKPEPDEFAPDPVTDAAGGDAGDDGGKQTDLGFPTDDDASNGESS